MATRTELFRYAAERSGPKKAPNAARVHGRRSGEVEVASHNEAKRVDRKAAYALEMSPGARPSRKSTRKAANRQKNDAQFRMKRQASEGRPPPA